MDSAGDRKRFQASLRGHLAAARWRVLGAGAPLWAGGTLAAAVAAAVLVSGPAGSSVAGKLSAWALLSVFSGWLLLRDVLLPLWGLRSAELLCRRLESGGDFQNLLVAAEEASRRPGRWGAGEGRGEGGGVAGELRRRLFAVAADRSESIDRARLLAVPDVRGNLAALICGAALAFWVISAGPAGSARGIDRLCHPLRDEAFSPTAGIYLQDGDREAAAGEDVVLAALDFGDPRESAVCEVRRGSGLWRPLPASRDTSSAGIALRWTARVEDVDESFRFRFRRDGMVTAEARIDVRHPPLLMELAGSYEPPAYTGLPARDLPRFPARIEAPAGSVVRLRGIADRALAAAAAVTTAGDTLPAAVAGDTLRWSRRCDAPLEFHLLLRDRRGATGGADLAHRVDLLPDSAPTARISCAERTGLLPVDGRLDLGAVAEDDYGLADLVLQFRRRGEVEAAGGDDRAAWIDIPVWRRSDEPGERAGVAEPRESRTALGPVRVGVDAEESEDGLGVSCRILFDTGDLEIVPGDVLLMRLEARDRRRPGPPGIGRSSILRLVMPSAAEILASRAETDESRIGDLAELRERSIRMDADLERITRELKKDPEPDFARRQEMETALERQRELQRELDRIAADLEDGLSEMALRNQTSVELLEKMQEVSDLLADVRSEELRRLQDSLREEMGKLTPDEIREAVAEAARDQQALIERLDRTISLLEQMRGRQELEGMAGALEEMLRRQQDLIDQAAASDADTGGDGESDNAADEEAARRQEALAEEIDRLAERIRSKLEEMGAGGEDPGSSSPAEESLRETLAEALRRLEERDPARAMRETAGRMRSGGSGSDESRHEAMRRLASLYSVILQGDRAMQARMQQQVAGTLRRIAFDVLALSAREEDLAGRIPANLRDVRAPGLTRDQARILRALRSLREGLRTLLGSSPMLSMGLLRRLDAAAGRVESSRSFLESGWGLDAAREARAGLGAMNALVINLLTSAESGGGGGAGSSPLLSERLRRLAGKQAGLNGLAEALRRGMNGRDASDMEQRAAMRRLQADQRSLAEETREAEIESRLDPEEARRMLGDLGDLSEQMESVARDLGQGVLDERTLRRQERILGRLLDAHNSVRRRDFSMLRRSRSADGAASDQIADPIPSASDRDAAAARVRRRSLDRVPLEYRDLVRRYYRSLEELAVPPANPGEAPR